MAKASDNAFPSILITEGTEPSAPAAGKQRLYIDSTSHKLKRTDSSGTDVTIEPAGTGDVATDLIWDAVGDLVQGTGANTGAKLSAGTAGYFLKAGGAATAVAWAARELDYVEYTAGTVAVTATSEATANTLVTGNAVAYDGSTIVCIEFFSPRCAPDTSSGAIAIVCLYDGASSIGFLALEQSPIITASSGRSVHAVRRLTPSNATHTYSIRAYTTAGTANFYNDTGGVGKHVPMFIRITRAI